MLIEIACTEKFSIKHYAVSLSNLGHVLSSNPPPTHIVVFLVRYVIKTFKRKFPPHKNLDDVLNELHCHATVENLMNPSAQATTGRNIPANIFKNFPSSGHR